MYGKFLNPTNDVVFKKIFGDKKHKEILLDFLNAVLERRDGQRITDALAIDPHNLPAHLDAKYSVVDIKCVDERNITYIIEMQVLNHPGYLDRCQYYTATEISRQLHKGGQYATLVPVIFVGIANFMLFHNLRYVSHHLILDKESHIQELKLMEFHFIELVKFDKGLAELETVIDQWAYFFRHAADVEKVPQQLKENKAITQAFESVKLANFSKKDLVEYDMIIDSNRIQSSRLEAAEQKGKEEGERAAMERVAMAMLADGVSVEKISKMTKLSIKDIENLKVR